MAGHKKPAIPTLFFATILSFALLPLQQRFFLAANPQPSVDTNQRVDCLPSRYPLEKKEGDCAKVGCIWDGYFDQYNPTVPQCFFPPNQGYQMGSTAEGKIQLKWPLNIALKNAYSPPNLDIQLESREMGAALALKIGNKNRFTPPVPLNREAKIESSEKLAFKYSSKEAFAFTVERESDGLKIWDTSIGGFVFGDKFIQIATFLPTDRIYGFGENLHHQLKHDFGAYKTWGMFSRDQVEDAYIPGSVNEYGVHPFYLGLESSGKAHGVLIFNSNAQEYTTGPGPHLIYRTIGGQIELFFFPGPTPEEVIRQYQQLIGRPYLPAYWAFGYQICRYGYKSLEDLKAVVRRTRQAEIPFDVQYADIDYMERYKDFTYDTEKWAEFPKYIDELHSMGMKLILIFDPPVQVNYSSFQRGLQMGATFVEWPTHGLVQKEINDLYDETKGTKIMLGAMWPDYHSAFPDWLDPQNKTTNWWIQEFVRFHKEIPFDGLWIDMNEPSVFGTNEAEPWYWKKDSFIPDKPHILPLKCPKDSKLDFPPYKTWNVYQHEKEGDPEISLCQNTLCMIGRMGRDSFDMYDTHSLYGWSEMVATQQALREATGGKRGAVISRSTFPSSGQHGGHWLGDNKSRWPDLRISIIGIQEFNMFGIPHVGSDVCGFGMDTNEELCLRWQQLGAFYSYYRNHNDINHPDQDPAQWPSVAKATKEANLFRYRHLPHLYSLHFRASLLGGTVVRSMFFEFPLDPNTHSMSFQFMWGPAILVLPVISPNVDSVHGYLPPGEFWYSMSMAHEYGAKMPPGYSTFNAPRNTPLPTFIRGGHIIPRQVPSITTAATRKNPFQLLIAFNSAGIADGELYWDDGDTAFDKIEEHSFCHFQFHAESNSKGTSIRIERKHSSLNEKLPNLEQIEIFGHLANVEEESIEMNGKRVDLEKEKCTFDSNLVVIEAKGMVDLNGQGPWELKWKNNENKPAGNGIFGGKVVNSLMIFGAFCVSIAAAIFH